MLTRESPPSKRMRLRHPGTCRDCARPVAAGEWATYYRATKDVQCVPCAHSGALVVGAEPDEGGAVRDILAPGPSPSIVIAQPILAAPKPVLPEPVITGAAGASARREHERCVAKREDRIRKAHPRLGGFILAVSDEPQSTQAWAQGARGEELLAKRLDSLSDRGVLLLHDRRIPPTRANIDHIAISSAGVFVIDAKRYHGWPHLRIEGGLLRPRTEILMVGRRDCTKLVAGVTKQVDLVRAALATAGFAAVPLRGMLCFVEADWPLIGGSFSTGRIEVLWPKKANERITAEGPVTNDLAMALHRHLASTFPPA